MQAVRKQCVDRKQQYMPGRTVSDLDYAFSSTAPAGAESELNPDETSCLIITMRLSMPMPELQRNNIETPLGAVPLNRNAPNPVVHFRVAGHMQKAMLSYSSGAMMSALPLKGNSLSRANQLPIITDTGILVAAAPSPPTGNMPPEATCSIPPPPQVPPHTTLRLLPAFLSPYRPYYPIFCLAKLGQAQARGAYYVKIVGMNLRTKNFQRHAFAAIFCSTLTVNFIIGSDQT